MSFGVDCPSCVMGKHDGHDPKWGIIPGLIGGYHCACTGDCKERFEQASLNFRQMFHLEGE